MRPCLRLTIALMLATLALVPIGASVSLDGGQAIRIEGQDSLEGVTTINNNDLVSTNALFATGEIQTAVDNANPGATIFLRPKLYYDNVKVWKSVNIIGSGPLWTIVDGSKGTDPNFGSVFAIGVDKNGQHVGGVTATLAGLTIRKGSGWVIPPYLYAGGGIYNYNSKLTVIGCIIRDNTADWGGGIYNVGTNDGIATLTLINSQIFSNTGDSYIGGGILNNGDIGTAIVTVKNSQIFGNTNGWGGGIFNMVYGGGVGGGGTATVNLINSQIFKNAASSWGGGINNHAAGDGTAIVNLINSRILGNTAEHGGGIFQIGYDSGTATVNMQCSSIAGNTVEGGGGGIFDYAGTVNMYEGSSIHDNTAYEGSGIKTVYVATVNMYKGSSIYDNTAEWAGGGVWNEGTLNMYKGSSIKDNSAKYGGGIMNDIGTVNLNGGSISSNIATLGGGIFNNKPGISKGTVNLQSGSIDRNTATASAPSGGGIYNNGGTITGNLGIVHHNRPDQIVGWP